MQLLLKCCCFFFIKMKNSRLFISLLKRDDFKINLLTYKKLNNITLVPAGVYPARPVIDEVAQAIKNRLATVYLIATEAVSVMGYNCINTLIYIKMI